MAKRKLYHRQRLSDSDGEDCGGFAATVRSSGSIECSQRAEQVKPWVSDDDDDCSIVEWIVPDSEVSDEDVSILRAFDNDRGSKNRSPQPGPSRQAPAATRKSPRKPKTPDRFQSPGPVSQTPKSKGAPAKNWCFTLNNYTDQELQQLKELDCAYIIIGKETGENETPHLQGYVQFERKIRFNQAKRAIGNRAHIEKARGTAERNKEYCAKDWEKLAW